MKRSTTVLSLGALAAAIVLTVCLWPREAAPEMAVTNTDVRLEESSAIRQTIRYTHCNHSMTRRVSAPVEAYGKPLEGVEALYPEWTVTDFSKAEAAMERELNMFCPDHLVVLPNEEGMLCLFENRYGDALVMVRELSVPLSSLPAAEGEVVSHGLAFDTPQEMEMWLESVES